MDARVGQDVHVASEEISSRFRSIVMTGTQRDCSAAAIFEVRHAGGVMLLGRLLRQTGPGSLVGQRLAGLDLCQTDLDLADEPVVVVQRAFERLVGQRLDRHASAACRCCEPALEFLRKVQLHGTSVQPRLLPPTTPRRRSIGRVSRA